MPDTAPPADGAALTSSYLQTMVREQVIRTVTSSTRPSAVEGMVFYETDTDRIYLYDGTGYIILAEPDQSWTPTWAGITIGNGTHASTYKRSDGWLDFRAKFTLGSTSAITGSVTLTVPVAAAISSDLDGFLCHYADSGTGSNVGATVGSTTTVLVANALNASSTYLYQSNLSSTVPMTWAVNDYLLIHGRYRMTTKYS